MASNETSANNARNYRILVIEDDENIAKLILASLSTLGLDCRWAPDGVAGVEVFEEVEPHLVLLDIMMPRMSGREVCAKIRETSTVPIIIMTALDREEEQIQGFKMGADDYIAKPFNPKLLIARVVAQLRRAYRYDAQSNDDPRLAAADAASVDTKATPVGWASCDACGYMGPRQKFEKENAMGQRFTVCPNCKQAEHVAFSIG